MKTSKEIAESIINGFALSDYMSPSEYVLKSNASDKIKKYAINACEEQKKLCLIERHEGRSILDTNNPELK